MLKSNYLKILSLSLVLILVFSCLSVDAFASTQNTTVTNGIKGMLVTVHIPFSCAPRQLNGS